MEVGCSGGGTIVMCTHRHVHKPCMCTCYAFSFAYTPIFMYLLAMLKTDG